VKVLLRTWNLGLFLEKFLLNKQMFKISYYSSEVFW